MVFCNTEEILTQLKDFGLIEFRDEDETFYITKKGKEILNANTPVCYYADLSRPYGTVYGYYEKKKQKKITA